MPLTSLILGFRRRDPADAATNAYFEEYLRQNTEAAETMRSMRDIIREFEKRTPRVKKSKCIDGRVHGSKAIGYPPGTVTFSRTEGNKVDLSFSNTVFWSRVNQVFLDAKRHTPGVPALFITLGHRSGHGHGCAAHGLDDAKALEEVRQQAARVQQIYKKEDLYVLYGMTNTDDMSEQLIFPDGSQISSDALIKKHALQKPSDVFQDSFLDKRIDDDATDRYVRNLTPRVLLEGNQAPMYRDLQTALAMEAYLLREVSRVQKNPSQNTLLNPGVLESISKILDGVKGLPDSLKGALMYQTIWNIAYALYQRNRLADMSEERREIHLNHAEELVCYGEGFELLWRNKAVLVKTGRGNDEDALRVAQKVLANNRAKKAQPHPPLVHINVEVSGELSSWDAFNDQVLSKIKTMLMPTYSVFEKDVRVLTTYSYKQEKMFYPVKIQPDQNGEGDARESYPIDVTRELTDQNFTRLELERRENTYSQWVLMEHQPAKGRVRS